MALVPGKVRESGRKYTITKDNGPNNFPRKKPHPENRGRTLKPSAISIIKNLKPPSSL